MQQVNFDYHCKSSGGAGGKRAGFLPQDVGESLFKAFFAHAISGTETQNGKQGQISLTDFSREVRQAVSLGGNLTLPPGSLRGLVELLEEQGIDAQKVDRLLAGATDPEGGVQLGLLVSGIREVSRQREAAQGTLIVRSAQVPDVAALLLNAGLGVGQVRGLMEKATSADGALEVDRLEKGLAGHFPGFHLEGKLLPLFSQFGIRCEPRGVTLEAEQADIRRSLEGLSTNSSAELAQKMRETLAGLLREKGIPPQEVKSFLEGMSLEYARSILKPKAEGKDGLSEQDVADLLNRARMPMGDRCEVRAPRAGAQAFVGERGSEGARDSSGKELRPGGRGSDPASESGPASHEATGEKGETPRVESRSAHELLSDKPKELKRPECSESSTRTFSTRSQEGPHILVQEPGKTGLPPSAGSGENGAYRETLLVLGERVSWMIQAGIQKARIRLSPPELGRLDVELSMDRGHLRAHIGAESVVAKEMIDAHLNHLKQHLSDLGFVVEEFDVLVGLGDDRPQGGDNLWTSWDERKPVSKQKAGVGTSASAAKGCSEGNTASPYQISLRV